MATCFGWSWEYIDEFVTVPRLKEITHYEKAHPPVHILVASYLGVGKVSEKKRSSDLAAFVADAVSMGADPAPLM